MPRLAAITSDAAGALENPLTWVLPIGAIEPHGPHLPLGTDVAISEGIAERLARRAADRGAATCVVLPAMSYAVTRCSAGFPGRVHISDDTVTAIVADILVASVEEGAKHAVVVNSHFEPGHIAAVQRGVEEAVERASTSVAFPNLTRRHHAERIGGEFQSGACHGGRYETSLMLAQEPDLVDWKGATLLPTVPVDLAAAFHDGKLRFDEMGMDQAYCGAPAEASAAEGEALYDVIVDIHLEALESLLAA